VTCNDVQHLVEAIAAEELEVEERIRAHFESCPRCAAELASARRLELALKARPVASPPARFTPAVMARIRNDHWKSEQHVDRIFNVAIAAAVALVAGGIVALTNFELVISAAGAFFGVLAQAGGRAAQQTAPTLLTYVAAAGLLLSTLAMWWWAERRFSL
jgi:anti-sigma factor RsiW